MRLALVIASDYHQSAQLPTLSRSLEDADRFAAYLDGSDLDFSIEELSADRHFSEQFEEALREPGAPLRELIVYFAGYVVTAPGRDPSLILDGDRLGAFALPRLRRLLEETARRALVVIDAVPVAHDGAEPEQIAEAIGAALGRHGALSVLVNVSQAVDSPLANSAVGTSFTDLVVFCWDTALKSDASETELAGLDVFESMRAEAAFEAFPAARYFPGRVDFDWASGTLESDHEISGLRSTSDEELPQSGNGLGARPPPLPAFTAQQAAPMAPSAPGVLASPLPIPPEALRAAAASVTFSSVPALRVPPPPPRSAPPAAPSRSVPPPLPRSAVPPPLPRSTVPPPLSRSAPPPPPAFAVAPPWPDQPSSMLPPPWPEPPPPVTFERQPLPAFQASLVDQEEELTEPGQPFAAIAEETTLPHHGGFGDAEDTEVTGASSALRALDAYFYPPDDAAGGESLATPLPLLEATRLAAGSLQPEEPDAAGRGAAELETSESDGAALAASDSEAAGLEAESAGLEHAKGEAAELEAEAAGLERAKGEAAQNEAARSEAGPSDPALAEAVTSSDAALNDLLATEVMPAEAALPVFSDTGSSEAPTPEALTLEEALSIESLLRDTPSEPASDAAPPTGAAASEAPPIAGAEPEELPATQAATPEQEQRTTAAAPEGRAEDAESEPAFEVAPESAAPNPGRRTLPSDFVTSVLEEAGVVVGDATAGAVTDRLPSVLPPDLVPRTSLETDPGHDALTQAFPEAGVPPRKEPRGALPSDLVERALAEAGVDASELAPRGERDVLEVMDVGEAEALEARQPSYVDEDAPDPSAPLMEPEHGDLMASSALAGHVPDSA
ncbi:MAG TPA: hypothetical protein VFU02_07715, partial [Polyangiaceae bacterium]|nr:hypothetical protein [Polyangiaceae bacterium]